jgi:hypothetical protein
MGEGHDGRGSFDFVLPHGTDFNPGFHPIDENPDEVAAAD